MDIEQLKASYDEELARQLYNACVDGKGKYLCVVNQRTPYFPEPFSTPNEKLVTTFFVANRRTDVHGAKYITLKKIRGIIIRNDIKSPEELLKHFVARKEQQ